MKVIIAGSRTISDPLDIRLAVRASGFVITEVVSGSARGADRLGEYWAEENHVPVKSFLADWAKHGKAAGAIRNLAMAEYADALIAVWDGASKGTAHMIKSARAKGLRIFVQPVAQ